MIKQKIESSKSIKKEKTFKFGIIIFILFMIIVSKELNIHSIFLINKNFGKIYLCTLYNNESEMAFIHLWRLYDYIDRFIFVISNITYSGLPKNITFRPYEQNIEKFMDKVDIVSFDNLCNAKVYQKENKVWCIENSQRDYAKTYIEQKYHPTESDLLIVVDIDEILTKEGIEYIKKNPPNNFYFIKGSTYFPYFYHKLEDWNCGFVVRYNKKMKALTNYREMKKTKPKILKFDYNPSKPLITHCSYCFKSIEEYKNKLKSFSHQEYNIYPYITNEWIFKSHYCRIKINSPIVEHDEPYEGMKNLIPKDERLKYLIDPSFMYNLNETIYTKKDLEILCDVKYNRKPLEIL